MSARQILDQVQNLAQLDAFEPARLAEAIAAEPPPAGETLADLAAQLDELRALLGEIDRFAQKSMRIRLTSATDALPQQFRTLLFSTITAYERDLPLLQGRVGTALARIDRTTAAEVTGLVMQAAERVLAARAALRQVVMEAAQKSAAAWLPIVQRQARDRAQPDAQRERWGRARVDLQQLGARGDRIDTGSFDERLAKIEAPADEPEEPGADRFSLLEID